MKESQRCEHFDIDPTTGQITMTTNHQPPQQAAASDAASCILHVVASDAGQPRRHSVPHLITVHTFHQSPTCHGTRPPAINISFTIEENTPPGSVVGYLSSSEYFHDDVSELEKTFQLVGGNALDTFSVDSVSGALVVGGPVDFEVCSWYDLVVWIFGRDAECIGEIRVEVGVVNVNDNPPQFDVDLTYITVREATPTGAEVYAPVAHDADGSALFYAARAGQSSEGVSYWLAVDDVTGHVVTRRPLEGAPRQMHVVITASDDVTMTSQTLIVTVVRDAAAGCAGRVLGRGRSQSVTVVEDLELGSVITAIDVSDALTSSCNSRILMYGVVSASDYDTFTVDRFTGQ